MKPKKPFLTAFEVFGVLAIVFALAITVPPVFQETVEGLEAARNIQQIIERVDK